MGTDIHLYVEKRDNANAKWEVVNPPKNTPLGNDWRWRETLGEPDEDGHKYCAVTWNIGRSYDTFSILANVRNGRGPAGVPTGDGFKVIAMPRGLPNDMSPELQNDCGPDYLEHTPHHLYLKEILDFDWDQTTTKTGVVNLEQFKTYLEKGKPESWHGGVSGPRVRHISNAEMRELISCGVMHEYVLNNFYTTVNWEVRYKESASFFYKNMIPELKKLGEPENVRLVMYFDS